MFCIKKEYFSRVQKLIAFTLAEVIIVVGIIGIIAQLTIPSLVANYQRKVFALGLKKAYIGLQSFFKGYLAEQGVTSLGDTELYDGVTLFTDLNRQALWDQAIKKHFRVVKSCDTTDSSCSYHQKYLTRTVALGQFGANRYVFHTIDGIAYSITAPPTCKPDYSKPGLLKGLCGNVQIDVNGPKGPNIWGRDIHILFYINYDGTLIPISGYDVAIYSAGENWSTSEAYWRNKSNLCGTLGSTDMPENTYGQCIPRIMEEGWEMNY